MNAHNINDHEHAARMGEIGVDVLKASPPVAAAGWTVAGHALNEWLVLLTLVYTALLIVHQLHKMWYFHKHGAARHDDS